MDRSTAMELFRRRMGSIPSTAGLPSGGNLNPNAQTPQGVTSSPLGQAPKPPQTASQPGREQLAQSRPGEGELILKALIKRLDNIPPQV